MARRALDANSTRASIMFTRRDAWSGKLVMATANATTAAKQTQAKAASASAALLCVERVECSVLHSTRLVALLELGYATSFVRCCCAARQSLPHY